MSKIEILDQIQTNVSRNAEDTVDGRDTTDLLKRHQQVSCLGFD